MRRSSLIGRLAVVLCFPAVTMAWLGFRLIQQDRALEAQRVAESRELSAGQAVQTLSALLSDPGLLSKTPGDGALLALLPDSPLLYRESVPAPNEAPADSFRASETLEFQGGDAASAAGIYREHAEASDPLVRAGALYRLGRALNKKARSANIPPRERRPKAAHTRRPVWPRAWFAMAPVAAGVAEKSLRCYWGPRCVP